jgi:hypothetical protein
MADYAGAVAAMRARFVAAWGTTTPVQYQNEDPPQEPWPPSPAVPWVYFEVIETQTKLIGGGPVGARTWFTVGNIFVHVMVPKGYALPAQLALAEQAGTIFRAATFYTSDPTAKVTTIAPSTDGGDSNADNGNWFAMTVSIPFEFIFLA